MHVEMIDLLRCPRAHSDTWLVVAAAETVARHVVRGTLGCPVCAAEYVVHDGVADFGLAPRASLLATPAREDDALRLAALLDLASPGGTVALGGDWSRVAADLMAMTDVRVLLLDPPVPPTLRDDLSAIRGGGTFPVAAASLRGVALDAYTADAPRLAAAVRALGTDGRLVAPATAPMPEGVTELARDETLWVATRGPIASPPIALSRAK